MGYVHKAFTKDRPDGIESLGKATWNIMEQGMLYHGAHKTDYGQRMETASPDVDIPHPKEIVYGRGYTGDVDEYYRNLHGQGNYEPRPYKFKRRVLVEFSKKRNERTLR